jgi:hypothetical protein
LLAESSLSPFLRISSTVSRAFAVALSPRSACLEQFNSAVVTGIGSRSHEKALSWLTNILLDLF